MINTFKRAMLALLLATGVAGAQTPEAVYAPTAAAPAAQAPASAQPTSPPAAVPPSIPACIVAERDVHIYVEGKGSSLVCPALAPAVATPAAPAATSEKPHPTVGVEVIARADGYVGVNGRNAGGKRQGDEGARLLVDSQGHNADRFGFQGDALGPDVGLWPTAFTLRLEGGYGAEGMGFVPFANDGSRKACTVSGGAAGESCSTAQGFTFNRYQEVGFNWGGIHPEVNPILRLVLAGHQLSPISTPQALWGKYGWGGFDFGDNLMLTRQPLWAERIATVSFDAGAIPDPNDPTHKGFLLKKDQSFVAALSYAPSRGDRGEVIGLQLQGGAFGFSGRFGLQRTQVVDYDSLIINGILQYAVGPFGVAVTVTRSNRNFLDPTKVDDHAVHSGIGAYWDFHQFGRVSGHVQQMQITNSRDDAAMGFLGYVLSPVPGIELYTQAAVWHAGPSHADPTQDSSWRPQNVLPEAPLNSAGWRAGLSVDAAELWKGSLGLFLK